MTHTVPAQYLVNLEKERDTHWDVIIIGAGMGGGTAAYSLASRGHKVLVIEKGRADFEPRVTGVEIEQEDPALRLASGKWPTRLTAEVNGVRSDIWAPLGCGIGGSTLLYAATLQRLRPDDFARRPTPDGNSVSWPFAYEELAPYYSQAESLFKVCGTRDPLEPDCKDDLLPPPAMSASDRHLFQEFQAAGLNPYRLNVAFGYQENCKECGGRICPAGCKQDARTSCILRGIRSGNLFAAEQAQVVRIDASEQAVRSLIVRQNGKEHRVQARLVLLAAGAYFSPTLLMRSKSKEWPDGLGNSSGKVGRNLMFHASDFIAVWNHGKLSRAGPGRTIGLRDLYSIDGQRLGEFQSSGLRAGYGMVLYALRLQFDQSPLRKLKPLRHLLRIPAFLASKLYGDATVFATIVEDQPYESNRVIVDDSTPSGMRFEYKMRAELETRVIAMRKEIRRRISALRSICMRSGVSLNYGHPCGTCKAGTDPRTSVLDKNCKSHDLDNLYVVDASFMPTSGGTNPSLTVAANALRVADHIDQRLRQNEV